MLLLSVVAPGEVSSQRGAVGLGIGGIVSGGDGVGTECYSRTHRFGFGPSITVPFLSRYTSVEATARAYLPGAGPSCIISWVPRPQNGTFVYDNRDILLASRWLSTDVRFQVDPHEVVRLGAGFGNAWQSGYDLPYFVLAGDIRLRLSGTVRLSIGGEYYMLRSSADRSRVTYEDFEVVDFEDLGRVHDWTHALSIRALVGIVAF